MAAWVIRPIIGGGLFVDGDVGAACATGSRRAHDPHRLASHAVVELMRQGRTAEEACREVIKRILRKVPDTEGLQVGFLALRMDGDHGGWSVYNGFEMALQKGAAGELIECRSERKWEGS
jgi:N4-(beta-N-acetylglucosaminyl)-L-asparaginase